MDTELTGRKVKVTPVLRQIADDGLARIEKIVGRGASSHVIFSTEKLAKVAEVTVKARHHTVVGSGEASESDGALRAALSKVEKQALRRKKSLVEKKRQAQTLNAVLPASASDEEENPFPARRGSKKKSVSSNGKTTRGNISSLHIVASPESMASQPMTIEQAVKTAESLAREVFVFRDLLGDVKVLHCPGDGIVRLTEVV